MCTVTAMMRFLAMTFMVLVAVGCSEAGAIETTSRSAAIVGDRTAPSTSAVPTTRELNVSRFPTNQQPFGDVKPPTAPTPEVTAPTITLVPHTNPGEDHATPPSPIQSTPTPPSTIVTPPPTRTSPATTIPATTVPTATVSTAMVSVPTPFDVAVAPVVVVTEDPGDGFKPWDHPCRQPMMEVVAELLAPHNIKAPIIWIEPHHHHGRYMVGASTIYLNGCVSRDMIAHELGHFIMDVANHFSRTRHLQDALDTFCPGSVNKGRCTNGWIKAKELSPGVEHAAHCIGFVLHTHDVYTKCPDANLVADAEDRLVYAAEIIPRR